MRRLVASFAISLAVTATFVTDAAVAKPGDGAGGVKRIGWVPQIPSEQMPLQIDRVGHLLVCTRTKDCVLTGRFGTNSRMLFALDGDDGQRRFALITAKGWGPQTLTIKVPASVPANTFHRLTIVDEAKKRVSNSIRVFVAHPSPCNFDKDVDGDGLDAVACGGIDCDDGDANRFPGNPEICDTTHHDEDCDPTTFGYRDSDVDGWPDDRCCNKSGDEMYCGSDCDDARDWVHRTQNEVCNQVDDDCDGYIDDTVQVKVYRDADKDLYGNPGESKLVCAYNIPIGWVLDARDCKDTDARVNPRTGCG
jgi:hypothetical protein